VEPAIIGLLGLIVFLIVMFMGVPVAFSMLLVGIAGIAILRSPQAAFQMAGDDIFTTFASYTMCVAPMFTLMGLLANSAGLGDSLFRLANKFLGHHRGGLAMATEAACAMFGAICGSMPATVTTFGSIADPEMKKYDYDDRLATGSIVSGAVLAVLIPPSMTLIIYGIQTENSIGALFMAGIIPGLLQCFLYILTIAVICKRNPSLAPVSERVPWGERFKELFTGGIYKILIVFVISLGGLFLGFFTPTEAGAVGVICVLVVALFDKKFNFQLFKSAIFETAKIATMIFFLLAGATVYGRFFSLSQIPAAIGEFVAGLAVPNWIILAIIIVVYLILGFFIDALPLILLTIPIFYPVVVGTLHYDPLWFGVILVIVLGMGAMTPPVGINCYIMKSMLKDVPLNRIFSGVWPFVISNLICCVILIAFPIIVTFLPGLFK